MSDRYEIYCHTSPSGKSYVGIAKQGMVKRWKRHIYDANHGSRVSFHCAIRKHGPDNFTHEILDVLFTRAGAVRAEKLWIRELDTYLSGYNETTGGDGVSGCSPSRETREKNRLALLGKPKTREHVERMANSKRGKKFSEQGRKNMSEAHKGLKASPEAIAKSAKARTGLKRTPEFCALMRAINTGRRGKQKRMDLQ